MIPLSKVVMRMSMRDRTNQELKWYEEPFYLCTTGGYAANRIKEECRRRKIPYEVFFVKERSTDKDKVQSKGTINYNQEYNSSHKPGVRVAKHAPSVDPTNWRFVAWIGGYRVWGIRHENKV